VSRARCAVVWCGGTSIHKHTCGETQHGTARAAGIPQIEPTGKPMDRRGQAGGGFAPGHELKLVLQRGVAASVQLPWVTCQKQAPSEAEVLRAVKGFYRWGREG
jgi:hypothetical protein